MCPVNPSDTEGEGIEPCPAVGLGGGRLGTGVAIESVTAGDEDEEGVEACSVASRFGAGEEAGAKSPHPKRKISPVVIQKSFVLFIKFN